ncbi:MAG: hypothetical protein ACD_24C00412G0002 [uncultured bacterium]|nr:MAG: hypothetical protein ACD_24C00412G0002 [uncultured bacterium]
MSANRCQEVIILNSVIKKKKLQKALIKESIRERIWYSYNLLAKTTLIRKKVRESPGINQIIHLSPS